MKKIEALLDPQHLVVPTDTVTRKIKHKKWRQNERSPVILLAFSILLACNILSVSSLSNEKNWKTDDNGFASGVKNLNRNSLTGVEYQIAEKGGTRWATAKEEAIDERRDPEILQAVFNSIAEWEERRRIRHTKLKAKAKRREKRSQSEKAEKEDDEEGKEPLRVCYDELGCFQEVGYIDLLPNSPEEVNTRYLLYNSRKSRGDTPLLDVSAQNVSSLWEWVGKAFNVSAPTKVIIHGFGSSCSNVWVYEMRSALMSVEDCNIICVDWEAGATIPNYVRAAANTRLVGKQVAILLSGLEKYVNLSARNVHVIGFSLGAHVAGFAGSEFKNLSRITGLDPAGPLFESQDRRARLDSMDAQFVDVIHSNGENLILGGLGAWQPMGHVDFYPNGGRMQKGCTNLFVGAVSDMIWSANEVYERSLCNHRRAYKFFTDSVSPKCQFPAVPCESYDHFIEGKCFPCENIKDCSNMGYYADKFSGRGTLYLLTRDEEPFCANQYMVRVESSLDKDATDESTKSSTFGKIQITLIGDLELNETFVITQKKDEKLLSGESISRIIVPHPALQNFLRIQILYIAYKGWLSSGDTKWKIDKISLTNSFGQVLSACKQNLELESGVPVMLYLVSTNCEINGNTAVNGNHTSKPNKNEIPSNHHHNLSYGNIFPHTQVVRIGNEILTTKHTVPTLALNPNLQWPNLTITIRDEKYNASVQRNITKIGIGVTEYLNDPWKQKTEFFDPTVNVPNYLDGENEDNGEGRRLNFKSTRKNNFQLLNATKNNPILSTTNLPPTTIAASTKTTIEKRNPYEFVTEPPSQQDHILDSTLTPVNTNDSKITEPVLKPKSPTTSDIQRSRKSQNVHRPNYGKSINVNNEWHALSTTDMNNNRKLINTASFSSAPHYNSSAHQVNILRIRSNATDVVDVTDSGRIRTDSNDRTLKKGYDMKPKNGSSQLFVVQFLPQKLVSFFEQAERYARLAFLPFITPQENVKGPERARRIRTLANRWTGTQPQELKEKYDLETEESRIVASVINSPVALTTSSFPYAYQVHQQHLWQHISNLNGNDYKYIPLIHEGMNSSPPKNKQAASQIPANNVK